MSAILKFDFPEKKIITFFWSKLSKLHKKDFARDNYIFPKTRGNKNKQWTHSIPIKDISVLYILGHQYNSNFIYFVDV